jgi:hypothetical protein
MPYEKYLQLNLADPENAKLAEYGSRIFKLLQRPKTQANQFLVATLDDFLGVLYALIFAKCKTRPFRSRKTPVEVQVIIKRAQDVAEGRVRTSGNWVSGFHFNSALFRIAATYHRGLKVVAGKETESDLVRPLLEIVEPLFPRWQHTDLDKIHTEVNSLKHEGEGLFSERTVDWEQAESAVEELLQLFEFWSDAQ